MVSFVCRLHTITTGDVDKPLMLLLHGFPELWSMWEHQMSAFRDEYNVAAIDMRGYGQSDRPSVRYVIACQNPATYGCWNFGPHGTLCQAAPNTGKIANEGHAVVESAGTKGLLH